MGAAGARAVALAVAPRGAADEPSTPAVTRLMSTPNVLRTGAGGDGPVPPRARIPGSVPAPTELPLLSEDIAEVFVARRDHRMAARARSLLEAWADLEAARLAFDVLDDQLPPTRGV